MFLVCEVLSLSFKAVVLLTKTAINLGFFSVGSEVSERIGEIPKTSVTRLYSPEALEVFQEILWQISGSH